MFKSIFGSRQPVDDIDHELELAMQAIHDRMERMLRSESSKKQRFASIEAIPSYYR